MSPPPPVIELLAELRVLLESPEADGEASRPAVFTAGPGRIVLRLLRHTERPGVRLLEVVTELRDGETSATVLAMGTPDELLDRLGRPGLPEEIWTLAQRGVLSLLRIHAMRVGDR